MIKDNIKRWLRKENQLFDHCNITITKKYKNEKFRKDTKDLRREIEKSKR